MTARDSTVAFRRGAEKGALLWLSPLGLTGLSMIASYMLGTTGLLLELAIAVVQVVPQLSAVFWKLRRFLVRAKSTLAHEGY